MSVFTINERHEEQEREVAGHVNQRDEYIRPKDIDYTAMLLRGTVNRAAAKRIRGKK